MRIEEIKILDDEGEEFFPYLLAKEELGKATSKEASTHALAAANCLDFLAKEIRARYMEE